MSTNNPYRLKDSIRCEFEVDKTQLQNFHALESGWHEIFHWLMSSDGKLSSDDNDKDHHEKISALWHNHVLTVLLDISHKNLKKYAVSFANGCGTTLQNEYTEDLRGKIEGWIGRLSIYLNYAYTECVPTSAIRIAESIKEQLEKSLPIANSSPRRRNFIQRLLDENSRPYFSMLGAVADIQSKFDFYMEQIENSGDMDAAQALLLTFVRNYCRIAKRFNHKLEELPSFYLHEILKATPKDAIQDSAYVILHPNTEMVNKTFSLPMGTRFVAGESTEGNTQYYSLAEKAYVVPTILESAHTLFQQGTRVITAPIALEGKDNGVLFKNNNPANKQQELGWAIASPMLLLAEGTRNVSLRFMMAGRMDLAQSVADNTTFRLFISNEDGWTERELSVVYNKQEECLLFTFTIADGDNPLSVCSKDIHGIDTAYPTVRILVNDLPINVTEMASVLFRDIQIKVEVSDIRTFSLYSEVGEMDSTQPFYPFGTTGEKGSWFIFGNEELAVKKIQSVVLRGTWNKIPNGGYTLLYKDYDLEQPIKNGSFKAICEWQENSQWNVCGNSPIQLFETDKNRNVKEDVELTLNIADNSLLGTNDSYAYTKKANGFYRIRLSEPSIGFGMDVYRKQFAEVMVHNSKAKERNQKPVPNMPIMPMLADTTLSYTAVDCLGEKGTLYRINDTNGYEKVELENGNIPLLPDLGKHYVYLNLTEIDHVKQIRFYFNLRYAKYGSRIGSVKDSGASVIEYSNCGESQWKRFPSECILQEDTNGLTRSGFMVLNTYDNTNKCLFTSNEVWIRIGFENDVSPNNIIVDGIYLNCFKVQCENGDGRQLPADSISALAIEGPRVLEVSQPIDGFGGKLAEDEKTMSIRTTTRISTRNRALNGCDYEKMILERFDDIEKVCCIPVAKDSSDVRIVVFPHPEKRVLPQLPNWKLVEIEQYIKSFVSPFAKIRVVNPTYETITINMTAILKKDGDADEARRRLYRRIYNFFVPWFVKAQLPELGKRYSYEELKAWLVNDEGIERCVSLTIEGGHNKPSYDAKGKLEDVYYLSSTESGILYPKDINIVITDAGEGIEDSSIGTNFIIG